jgi:hypothetical protein
MSQCTDVLKHMKRYGSITPLYALNRYGVMRLAARIGELKELHHRIDSTMIQKNGKWFARYTLKPPHPALLIY